MSVLACGRLGCENIMCDRMLLGEYICADCFEELRAYKATWPDKMRAGEVRDRIRSFMDDDPPGTHLVLDKSETDAEFERLTQNGYDDEEHGT